MLKLAWAISMFVTVIIVFAMSTVPMNLRFHDEDVRQVARDWAAHRTR